ncbi:MAG: hypothetical protein ACQCN6_09140 [Candidatus Bathyarchaeia archaeon]|jgi:cytoskeletal protein RodZ
MQKNKETTKLQKTKLFVLSVLAALLVCSAFSVAAAQEEPSTTPSTAEDNISTATAPDQSQGTPVEGNQSDPSVSDEDLAPIHEVDGVPAFGIPPNENDPTLTGEEAQLYSANTAADNNSQEYTWIATAIGVVLAVVVGGVIGVVYFRKQAKAEN